MKLVQLFSEMNIEFGDGDISIVDQDTTDNNDDQSTGFNVNIESETESSDNFRTVLFTTKRTQLVTMSLKPGEDIGSEVHDGDQFFRFEQGVGKIIIAGNETSVSEGSAAVVPSGSEHNVINTSDTEDLKLYAIYSPPQHRPGTVNKTKPSEDNHE